MWKTLVIFVVCLVTVCCVWGLNDRLHYEGFKTAVEYVQGSVDVVVDDVSAFSTFAFAVENFSPESRGVVEARGNNVTLRFSGVEEVFTFSSSAQASKIARVLSPLTMGIDVGEGAFQAVLTALNAVLFWVGVLVTVIIFLVTILLDFVGVAWGVVQSVLYLIGIGALSV